MLAETSPGKSRVVLEPVQWRRVLRIEDLEPICDDDYEVLKEVREVLLRHGYQDRFGLCLLHKHFDLAPGEMALEETNERSRTSTIRVVPEETCRDAMETAWHFSNATEVRAGRNCDIKCNPFGLTGHSRKHECKLT